MIVCKFLEPGMKKLVIAVFMMVAVMMVHMEGVWAATCETWDNGIECKGMQHMEEVSMELDKPYPDMKADVQMYDRYTDDCVMEVKFVKDLAKGYSEGDVEIWPNLSRKLLNADVKAIKARPI
ncbi:hypothetical protein [Moorena sp. SIO2C4]|uniref:hypothetical protein n=1 Tax=Moorena sp. SIO2C4 TaxID=2607824 RepID=UPI002579E000|nr:hypothetical protein [Moorena sp. SIO2C4]